MSTYTLPIYHEKIRAYSRNFIDDMRLQYHGTGGIEHYGAITGGATQYHKENRNYR